MTCETRLHLPLKTPFSIIIFPIKITLQPSSLPPLWLLVGSPMDGPSQQPTPGLQHSVLT